MEESSTISGFVLAGGKSTRMGTDKALLMIHDLPLLQHMIHLIQPFCQDVFISGQNLAYSNCQVEMIPDVIQNCGPIAGLYSSLSVSENDWNLIVSFDTPFVTEDLLLLLIQNASNCNCVIPKHHFGVEPLIALYHKSCLSSIEKSINSGNYKLIDLISKLDTTYIDCNDLVGKYPKLFFNLNRMEDYLSI